MAITMKEILKDKKFEDADKATQANLLILLEKINKVRTAYNKSMAISSGWRSPEDQIRIYKEKGITDPKKVPMGSQHIKGAAVDIYDPKQELQAWVKANIKLIEEIGLWMEEFSYTKNWIHFQLVPPASGKRFFIP